MPPPPPVCAPWARPAPPALSLRAQPWATRRRHLTDERDAAPRLQVLHHVEPEPRRPRAAFAIVLVGVGSERIDRRTHGAKGYIAQACRWIAPRGQPEREKTGMERLQPGPICGAVAIPRIRAFDAPRFGVEHAQPGADQA